MKQGTRVKCIAGLLCGWHGTVATAIHKLPLTIVLEKPANGLINVVFDKDPGSSHKIHPQQLEVLSEPNAGNPVIPEYFIEKEL